MTQMAQNLLDLIKGGKWSIHTLLVACTAYLSWQINEIESAAWTVHMQAVWAAQVSEHNPTNWIPNAYTIFHSVKNGKQAPSQRIAP